MMMLLSLTWYLLRVALYPARLVLYVVHGFFIFLSKPGARFLVPALLIGSLLWQYSVIAAVADPLVLQVVSQLHALDPELYALALPYRFWIIAGLALLLVVIAVYLVSKLIRPIIGALPAPAPPIFPRLALRARQRRLRTVSARLVVRPRGGRSRRLPMKRLIRRLDPEVRTVFAQSGQAQARYAALMEAAAPLPAPGRSGAGAVPEPAPAPAQPATAGRSAAPQPPAAPAARPSRQSPPRRRRSPPAAAQQEPPHARA